MAAKETYLLVATVKNEGTILQSKVIESVSRISAEDTARRFFRKNGISMDLVVKEQISSTWAEWVVTKVVEKIEIFDISEFVEPVEPVKTEEAPKDAMNDLQMMVEALWDRWNDESEYEDWNEYVALAKAEVEKKGASFIKMTRRPFALHFSFWSIEHVIKVTASKVFVK